MYWKPISLTYRILQNRVFLCDYMDIYNCILGDDSEKKAIGKNTNTISLMYALTVSVAM